jgi:hypothetical protein
MQGFTCVRRRLRWTFVNDDSFIWATLEPDTAHHYVALKTFGVFKTTDQAHVTSNQKPARTGRGSGAPPHGAFRFFCCGHPLRWTATPAPLARRDAFERENACPVRLRLTRVMRPALWPTSPVNNQAFVTSGCRILGRDDLPSFSSVLEGVRSISVQFELVLLAISKTLI